MNNKGFTLIELLTVVLIVAVLVAVAAPQYTRSTERARATEAMTNVKALNDAIYAYAAGRSGGRGCPQSFKKLVVTLQQEATDQATDKMIFTKDFKYVLDGATAARVPGTDCPGVTAQRNSPRYDYVIWNPFKAGTGGRGTALACYSPNDLESSNSICNSLGLDTTDTPYEE